MNEHRVILVRHGRTTMNVEDRLRGLADPDLDAHGVHQAHAVAAALEPRGISQVLTSPLQRAVHTGQIIADTSGVPRSDVEGFNDRDYGPWTGELRSTVLAQWGEIDRAPGVEARQAVLDRVLPAMLRLATARAASPIVVVTHDAVIRPLLQHIQPGISPLVPPASWAELTWSRDAWHIASVDNQANSIHNP